MILGKETPKVDNEVLKAYIREHHKSMTVMDMSEALHTPYYHVNYWCTKLRLKPKRKMRPKVGRRPKSKEFFDVDQFENWLA